jgi:hypothetical protein
MRFPAWDAPRLPVSPPRAPSVFERSPLTQRAGGLSEVIGNALFINCARATIGPPDAMLLRERCRPNASAEARELPASGWPLVPALPL